MITNSIEDIASKLWELDNFILVGHATPDGDCVGSLAGLYSGLVSIGKKCDMFLADPVPPIYHYLQVTDKIQLLNADVECSTLIYLDCSDAKRVGDKSFDYLHYSQCNINIDHHYTNDFFADYNLVDAGAAATAEIIYHLLKTMSIPITQNIASALYAGLVMDTGRFSYSNTTGQTLRTAADLLDTGLDRDAMRINLFESRPREEIHLLGEALKSLTFSNDGKIAWMTLSYKQLNNMNMLNVYPEDIINYTRMIAGVEVGLLFREIEPGLIKIGFRSKDKIDVSAIAAQWGGGGHKQAAGARQHGLLEEIEKLVITSVRDVIK
ncbi:MAG TPA: bifunctional oligoribonuclease/PAP phosphatase NrnA [Syntrophomonadaceae bacterium]|nr:bifunctional oligoribonuclease/PAP phosphatase NrnA [Syntrophomonadaceae bacterium]